MTGRLLHYCILFAVLLTGDVTVVVANDEDTGSGSSHEYFIQQEADEAVLIRIDSFEAEFESTVTGPAGEEMLVSGLSDSRIAPVFQFIDGGKESRQLGITVTSSLRTNRSKFDLGLTRLKVWDERSATVARAYQLLSFGMSSSSVDNQSNWTVRINSLMNAGRMFDEFGMKELRLWSNYLAAHLVFYQLHDHNLVLGMTRDLLSEVRATQWREIALATLQLQSAALIRASEAGTPGVIHGDSGPVQAALAQTAGLASTMGYRYEHASAINESGVQYAARAQYSRALQQFQTAVEIADSLGDGDLATRIRESMVEIHNRQGDAPSSSEVLQEIESQLIADGGGDELALNLLQQGRLFIDSFRYPQAIEVLSQALTHENDSGIRKQLNFELARTTYHSGYLDQSMTYLLATGIRPGEGPIKRYNSLFDIGQALQIMANIHRERNAFDAMGLVRDVQGQFLAESPQQPPPGRAAYLYERARDALAQGRRQNAQSGFRQSYQAAVSSGQSDLVHLSRMQFCALSKDDEPRQSFCSGTGIRSSYHALFSETAPGKRSEAMFLHSKIQLLQGDRKAAIATMDQLLDELHFFRHLLPGVLGAWYRERSGALFDYYLELVTAGAGQGMRGRVDGARSLLVLSKIRWIENHSGSRSLSSEPSPQTDAMRVKLAGLSTGRDKLSNPDTKIYRGLDNLRAIFAKEFEFLSAAGMRDYLAGLSDSEALVSYHLSANDAYIWVGWKGKVVLQKLGGAAQIRTELTNAGRTLPFAGNGEFKSVMDSLGRRLLVPVADLLPETIYLVAAGSLLGFPLDALRLNDRYLVQAHQVINLASFPANPKPVEGLFFAWPGNVFLAGFPQDFIGGYATRLDTTEEIRDITNIFVGPGLRIVQGSALLADEFEDQRFQQAALAHLSMPGIIDFSNPGRSGLELSEDNLRLGRARFSPVAIQPLRMQAGLVFLSSMRVVNHPSTEFHSRVGLISGFMETGAAAVVTSLWDNDGQLADEFIVRFYDHLRETEDISNALLNTKREFLQENDNDAVHEWSSFQLFIN